MFPNRDILRLPQHTNSNRAIPKENQNFFIMLLLW